MMRLIPHSGFYERKPADFLSPIVVESMESKKHEVEESFSYWASLVYNCELSSTSQQNPVQESSLSKNANKLIEGIAHLKGRASSSQSLLNMHWVDQQEQTPQAGRHESPSDHFEDTSANPNDRKFVPENPTSLDQVTKATRRTMAQVAHNQEGTIDVPRNSPGSVTEIKNKPKLNWTRARRDIHPQSVEKEGRRTRSLSDPTNKRKSGDLNYFSLHPDLTSRQQEEIASSHLLVYPDHSFSSFTPHAVQNATETIADDMSMLSFPRHTILQPKLSFDTKLGVYGTEHQQLFPKRRRPLVQHHYKDYAFQPTEQSLMTQAELSSLQPSASSPSTSAQANTRTATRTSNSPSLENKCPTEGNETAHFALPWESAKRPFPEKLYGVLLLASCDESLSKVVSWQQHGRSFLVHRPHAFVEIVLKKYFRQSKFTSFQRQLNLYGFKRFSRGLDRGSYYHELFLRGRPSLCQRILRTRIKGVGIKPAPNPSAEPDFYQMRPCLESDGESLALANLQQQDSFLQTRSDIEPGSCDSSHSANYDIEDDSAAAHSHHATWQSEFEDMNESRLVATGIDSPQVPQNIQLQSAAPAVDPHLERSVHLAAEEHRSGCGSLPEYAGINFYSHSLINLACNTTNESSNVLSKTESPQPYFASNTVDPSYWLPANASTDGCATLLPGQTGLERNALHATSVRHQDVCYEQGENEEEKRPGRRVKDVNPLLAASEQVEDDPLLDGDIAGVEPDLLKLFESQFDSSRNSHF